VYVIAEAGANHNRDLGIARELIDVAVEAGADAVKFQTYSGKRIYSSKTPRFGYLEGISDKAPAELLEDISLPREWQPKLASYARERGIDFFSTPFDHEAVAELERLDVPIMKVASFEIVDLPLIRRVASSGIPMIISTGMATMAEIDEAVSAAREAGAGDIGLMQCTSVYPALVERANLASMETMSRAFGVPAGLSDHTEGIAVSIAAAALGAAFVEKHFTLDRSMEGPDHSFAIEPDELNALVKGVREARSAIGDGLKRGPSPEEAEEMYRLARRSLIVVGDHLAGTRLEEGMLTVKRPGFGIAPKHLELIVGRELKVDVTDDEILTWEML
jgi:sialic acid synthase SpsE